MPHRFLLAGLLTGFSILALFELTSLDIAFQRHFFDSQTERWFWSGGEPLKRMIFYTGAKGLIILFGISLIVGYCLRPILKPSAARQRGIRIVLLSMILVPSTVALLKRQTHVAYPRNLEVFGGPYAYTKILEHYPPGRAPNPPQRGFPAGHASAGYALLSLFYLFQTRMNQYLAVLFALLLGSAMGIYKILIGDHFLSHTLISLCIAWVMVILISRLDDALFRNLAPKKHKLLPGNKQGIGE